MRYINDHSPIRPNETLQLPASSRYLYTHTKNAYTIQMCISKAVPVEWIVFIICLNEEGRTKTKKKKKHWPKTPYIPCIEMHSVMCYDVLWLCIKQPKLFIPWLSNTLFIEIQYTYADTRTTEIFSTANRWRKEYNLFTGHLTESIDAHMDICFGKTKNAYIARENWIRSAKGCVLLPCLSVDTGLTSFLTYQNGYTCFEYVYGRELKVHLLNVLSLVLDHSFHVQVLRVQCNWEKTTTTKTTNEIRALLNHFLKSILPSVSNDIMNEIGKIVRNDSSSLVNFSKEFLSKQWLFSLQLHGKNSWNFSQIKVSPRGMKYRQVTTTIRDCEKCFVMNSKHSIDNNFSNINFYCSSRR